MALVICFFAPLCLWPEPSWAMGARWVKSAWKSGGASNCGELSNAGGSLGKLMRGDLSSSAFPACICLLWLDAESSNFSGCGTGVKAVASAHKCWCWLCTEAAAEQRCRALSRRVCGGILCRCCRDACTIVAFLHPVSHSNSALDLSWPGGQF